MNVLYFSVCFCALHTLKLRRSVGVFVGLTGFGHSVETPRIAELRSAGPFDFAQGRLARAAVPTWALSGAPARIVLWARSVQGEL